MIALKKILVPTDFSETSKAALDYARSLADAFNASMHVLHVMDVPPGGAMASELYVPPPQSFLDEWTRTAREQLEKLLTVADRQKHRAELVLVTGRPFPEVVRYAETENIDLIVMGTHGRGPVVHMLIGSVAERVLRKAPCPVLTVRQAASKT